MGEKRLREYLRKAGAVEETIRYIVGAHEAFAEPDDDALKPGDEAEVKGINLCGGRFIVPDPRSVCLRETMQPLDLVTDLGQWRIHVDPSLVRKCKHE